MTNPYTDLNSRLKWYNFESRTLSYLLYGGTYPILSYTFKRKNITHEFRTQVLFVFRTIPTTITKKSKNILLRAKLVEKSLSWTFL